MTAGSVLTVTPTIEVQGSPMAKKQQFTTMDSYITTCPKDVQRILQKLRRTIRKAVPDAVETISYQMPTFKLNGKFLVSFAAWQHHIGIYPIPSGTAAFKKEIAQYKGAKDTARLPIDKAIPYDLVAQLAVFRMKEQLKRDHFPLR
jgi:uncharacterized protein YdhG (YjbR/CyaY superfamily)